MNTTEVPEQTERIVLIPPTHEQTVYGFHVENTLAEPFLAYLEQKGTTPWRPPVELEKAGPDGKPVIQIDIEHDVSGEKLEDWIPDFLKHEA